jgi:hypothetical protein
MYIFYTMYNITDGAESPFGSRYSLSGCGSLPDWLTVGERVLVRPYSLPGTVAFIGETQFAPGVWVGVALQAANGKLFVILLIIF